METMRSGFAIPERARSAVISLTFHQFNWIFIMHWNQVETLVNNAYYHIQQKTWKCQHKIQRRIAHGHDQKSMLKWTQFPSYFPVFIRIYPNLNNIWIWIVQENRKLERPTFLRTQHKKVSNKSLFMKIYSLGSLRHDLQVSYTSGTCVRTPFVLEIL